jgi:hypothetical protein
MPDPTVLAALNRRISDSAKRAAELIRQVAEENEHTDDLEAEKNHYLRETRC